MAGNGKHRDIVVIGASAGGVEALTQLIAGLPADLPASVFVVLHIHPDSPSLFPRLLNRRSALPAAHAVHGEMIAPGRVYVAPADNHLMLRSGYMDVVRGPKETGHRPSVDALFRTAAKAYGPRVIGVVLTGYRDCGTAGLMSIKARGGVAVVQDPADAAVPDMPASAMKHVAVDQVATLAEMPALITKLVSEPPGLAPAAVPQAIRQVEGDELGTPSEVVCPSCNGKLTEVEVDGFPVFRCHVGHAFSLRTLAVEQADQVERALWAASRALEESASLAERMANTASGDMEQRFRERHESLIQQARVIRQIILGADLPSPVDSAALRTAMGG
jgi:two-component system chemotaxis response regulator CheB